MKKQILAEEVDQIIQQSFWGKGGVRLTESVQEPQAQDAQSDDEQQEQIEEAVEGHVCPLCESQLEDAISDERLAEHVDFMVGVISEMEDISDEDLTELAEEIASDEADDQEDLEEGKKPGFLKKLMKGKKG